jgi:hypothetical protein
VASHFENRDNMIGVLFRFQIEDQWRKTNYTERSGRENSALKT